MSEWIEWTGGAQPISDEVIVQVRYRPRHWSDKPSISTPAPARWFCIGTDWWRHQSPNRENDIVAYRLT